jgi:hypothetical protein
MMAIAMSSRDAGGDGRWEFDIAMELAWSVERCSWWLRRRLVTDISK